MSASLSSSPESAPAESAGSGLPAPLEPGSKAARLKNLSWTISLFGTAVGAGVLFLPINAGAQGLWPLLIGTILIGPMTYLSHRAMARFVCVSPRKGEDITVVARDYFGGGVGAAIGLLYFLAIFPIVLIYGVSITNTVDSLIVNQLGGPQIPRALLSFVLIGAMMLVMVLGEKIMLAVTGVLVYPLIALLAAISIYLIPSWKVGDLAEPPSGGVCLLVVFTMGFVWSCALSLGKEGLAAAREANLPVLSHLANVHDAPFISYLGPIIAIAAIGSSFFGHYLGAAEGAAGIVRGFAPSVAERLGSRKLSIAIALFIFLSTWLIAVINPSILSVIETLSGPVIAAILYIMPMVAIHKVPALAEYRGKLSNIFVVITGSIAIAGIVFGLISSGLFG